MTIQRRAVVQLGPDAGSLTDYTCDIAEFVINEGRALVQKAPSFGSPAREDKAAAGFASVTMSFLHSPNSSSGLWQELWAAMQTVTGELFFQVRYSDAAVSSSNPKRTGYIKVVDLDTGGPAYQARRQSKTFPARSVSDPLAS